MNCKQLLEVENATTEVPMVNLEMSMNPGGSSNAQEAILMKILMWNCRESHNANFMSNLRTLLEWNNPCVLALTETRMEDHDRILQSLDFTDVIQVPAARYSGAGATLINWWPKAKFEWSLKFEYIFFMKYIIVNYLIFLRHNIYNLSNFYYFFALL
ncbi:hypothetical protein RDI58_007060 [Solanum bulbocastanum]|uniref:Endonuclease/exonuclease/phosphatase domain-containing protein n=1 Tax=Solanum bulbocastanum TaxID=147425 RepID=A0AAN8TYI7_SOLBU